MLFKIITGGGSYESFKRNQMWKWNDKVCHKKGKGKGSIDMTIRKKFKGKEGKFDTAPLLITYP